MTWQRSRSFRTDHGGVGAAALTAPRGRRHLRRALGRGDGSGQAAPFRLPGLLDGVEAAGSDGARHARD